jgi:Putative transposase
MHRARQSSWWRDKWGTVSQRCYLSSGFKDYRHHAQQKTMTLEAEEFIRRFLLHVLPAGFQRIRYYGFLAKRYREQN